MSAPHQRIAIIGSGIAGLGAAYLLHRSHDITLYEKNDYVGGHARTRTALCGDTKIAVDTGFIVFNHQNYPHLTALFNHLGVATQKSVMSFGINSKYDLLEWGAESLNALFGQRRNFFRPDFYKFLFDILTFNRKALRTTKSYPLLTLGELIDKLRLGDWFRRYYILPMGGAIWSSSLRSILNFPAKFFVDFFEAHGLLSLTNQPQWYTVSGGSAHYIEKLIEGFAHQIKTSCGVTKIKREADTLELTDTKGEVTTYDRVVFACHANEILSILEDPSDDERSALSSFRYQKNMAVLHRYDKIMPEHRRCWSSWVYHADEKPSEEPISVTYWMNHLQGLDLKHPLFVSLNPRIPIPEEMIFERHVFDHPIYDPCAVAAQSILPSLQGERNTWFCGAYHRNGFHEDGLASAVAVAKDMGITPPWL